MKMNMTHFFLISKLLQEEFLELFRQKCKCNSSTNFVKAHTGKTNGICWPIVVEEAGGGNPPFSPAKYHLIIKKLISLPSPSPTLFANEAKFRY